MIDERVRQEYNKIGRETALIIYYFAVISFVIKTALMEYSFNECIFEFITMMIFPIYQLIRAHQLGLAITSENKKLKSNIFVIIVCAFVGAIVYLKVRNSEMIDGEGLVFFITYIIAFLGARLLFIKYEKKREKKLESKYDD